MPKFTHAKGRISESLKFISQEMNEFERDYSDKTWKDYQNDTKLQKLMDRTVENILTAIIEISGTVLTEEGIAVESYSDALRKYAEFYGLSEEESENLARLAVQRNRLAHRYLNFRWQAIKMFVAQKGLIQKLLTLTLEREIKKTEQQ